MNNWKFTTI